MIKTASIVIRSAVFYIGYSLLTIWFSISGILLFGWLPYSRRRHYFQLWATGVVRWLRICCGVTYTVEGRGNIPDTPCVILSKHQSQWETFALPGLFSPVSTLLKKELFNIPGFGWGLRLMKPIPIDRANPRQALRTLLKVGSLRLKENISVLVFPEGTRVDAGSVGKYARSGAQLAIDNGVPVVMVAHNAGTCWPAGKFLKFPGNISVVISKPIPTTGKSSRELTEEVQQWIEGEIARINT